MNKSLFVIGLLAVQSAFSQQPTPPFYAKPPVGSAWDIEISKDSDKATPAKTVNRASSGKDEVVPSQLAISYGRNGIAQGSIRFSDGSQQIYFADKEFIFQKAANNGVPILVPMSDSEIDPFSLKVVPYPGMVWLSASNFRGIEKRSGTECFHFSDTETPGGASQPGRHFEAWIRTADKKPVEVILNSTHYVFSEITPYDSEVPLPEVFTSALSQRKAESSAIELIRKKNLSQKTSQSQ